MPDFPRLPLCKVICSGWPAVFPVPADSALAHVFHPLWRQPFLLTRHPSLVFSSEMLLVLGDSFAPGVGRRCSVDPSVCSSGRRGGRISDESFRRWAIRQVFDLQPRRVLLMVGGNDIDQAPFSARQLCQLFEELVLGILAAGATEVYIFPVPPRVSCRHVSASVYRRRRRLLNLVLRRFFARWKDGSQVVFSPFHAAMDFIGGDGVHPSAAGWRAVAHYINTLVNAPLASR